MLSSAISTFSLNKYVLEKKNTLILWLKFVLAKMLFMGIPFMYTVNAEKAKRTGLSKMTKQL